MNINLFLQRGFLFENVFLILLIHVTEYGITTTSSSTESHNLFSVFWVSGTELSLVSLWHRHCTFIYLCIYVCMYVFVYLLIDWLIVVLGLNSGSVTDQADALSLKPRPQPYIYNEKNWWLKRLTGRSGTQTQTYWKQRPYFQLLSYKSSSFIEPIIISSKMKKEKNQKIRCYWQKKWEATISTYQHKSAN
jgi:hypothetical protein